MKLKRAKSVTEILNKKFDLLPFDGEWNDSVGCPELKGSWIIWGESGNGKTRFAMQLAKYLTRFCKVAYIPLEEGVSLSLKKALKETNMQACGNQFIVLEEDMEQLIIRLNKQKSPRVIFIDSLQYSGLNYTNYKKLRADFPNKLFIFISHAEGKLPEGRVGKKVRYDAFVKIRVEGYRAFPVSRYGGGKPYTIWEKGAEEYWSRLDNENNKYNEK